jgi:XTP/dITP diphosphohydrolase
MDDQIIYFATSNTYKFAEAKVLLPMLEQAPMDIPEEQSIDALYVVKQKLANAIKKHDGPIMVEDTSLYLEGLNGFPGPLIKWMSKAVGNQGIYELCKKINNRRAVAKTVIGYSDKNGDCHYFEGEVGGMITSPVGNDGFGWDSIFLPDGLSESFAEMGDSHKVAFSMRTQAFSQLKSHIESTR